MFSRIGPWTIWVGLIFGPTLVAILAHWDVLSKVANNPNFWVAVFTLLLVAFTGLLAWVTYLQVQTARASQRAYVSVNPAGIEYLEAQWDVLGHVVFENAGHLPAANFRWRIYLELEEDEDWTPPTLSSADLEAEAVLPVGAKWKMGSPTLARPMGASYVFVWGRVEYTDGFGRARFTNFCHRYRWTIATTTRDADDARFHKSGNEGD